MAEVTYNRGKLLLVSGDIATRDLRMAAFTGTQTGADDVDLNTVADLAAVAGVSVHTERLTLANVTATEDDANNRVNIDCDALVFAAAVGVVAQGVVIYDEGGGTDATRPLIDCYTTGFPQPMTSGLTVNVADWHRVT